MPTGRLAAVRRQMGLHKRKDFEAVFQKGQVLANRLLVLRSLPNQLPHNRYGFITSKRVGKAVVRNRVRRRLREGLHTLPTHAGWDVVISARARAAQADFQELKAAVANLFVRAGIFAEDAAGEEKKP
jgi:ribonuclease P protein component